MPRLIAAWFNIDLMIHEVFPVGVLQCNCSVIGDEVSGEAMVVDPGDNIDRVIAIALRHKLVIKQIVVTHAHIDHIGGAMKLKAITGAPILLNQNDQMLVDLMDVQATWIGVAPPGEITIDHDLQDQETLKAGSLSATVLHTPGHTEGSVCLYFAAQAKLIAGDTLFAGSIGRTDLPGGSHKKIIASIKDSLLALPDETIVFPGHGQSTTIGAERETNPFLV